MLASAAMSAPSRKSAFGGLDLREHTLDNGLRAFIVPDRTAPVLTCQVWYRVGSADEREADAESGEDHGITGLSHFYEHLMFRGTDKHPKFFDAIYARGGQLNAWTWLDATCYWEKLPAGNLRFALEAEADRLQHMRLHFLDIEPEREVVKSERMMRTDDDPSGAATERLHRLAFREHPYGWPTVGWMHDLNRITLDEAETYHHHHYLPANAFVVAVGDFSFEEAVGHLEQTFGPLERREPPTLAPRPVEPEPDGARRGRIEHTVSSPILQVAWPAPAGAHADFAALEVLNHVLARGKSGRIQRSLVFGDDPVATSVSASLFPMRDPYLYHWELRVKPGVSARQAEERLLQELARLASEPPDDNELAKVSLGLAADTVRGALTTQGKADSIGFAYLATGDPLAWFDRVDRYAAVTDADVARLAASVLAPQRRTTVVVTAPEACEQAVRAHLASGAAAPDAPDTAGDPGVGLLLDAMAYARGRAEVRDREAALDEEAAAIEHLELRRQAALSAAADDDARAALNLFADGDSKGPTQRLQTLERGRAENAEARLALETRGVDLRSLPDLEDHPLAGAAQAYLGQAAPADIRLDADRALEHLLAGRLHDLRGELQEAQRRYQECLACADPGPLADSAWERLQDV